MSPPGRPKGEYRSAQQGGFLLSRLRERLIWDGEAGTLHDGPRRYLMLRPDVLMGAVQRLDGAAQAAMFDALAAAVQQHGADSLRAYAVACGGDPEALIAATVQAAADLGWGRWVLQRQGVELHLHVHGSPFAQGWCDAGAASPTQAVCAPIRGMLQALATQVFAAPAIATECGCVVAGLAHCTFLAKARA